MRRNIARIGRPIALAVGLVISGVGATVVMAQGAPAALEAILTALQQLQTSINGVQQSVNSVQQSVDALGAANNFTFTPVVIVESGIVDCNHANVTNVDRHVATQLINAGTGAVVTEDSGVIATAPGHFRGVGAFSPFGFSGNAYCKFTVLDGTKADIRGNLTLTPNIAGNETTAVSVAAY